MKIVISKNQWDKLGQSDPYAAINLKVAAMIKVFADDYAEILSASEGGRAKHTYDTMKKIAEEIAEDLYQIRRRNEN